MYFCAECGLLARGVFHQAFSQWFSLTKFISYWNPCIWLAESKLVSENHWQNAWWNAPLVLWCSGAIRERISRTTYKYCNIFQYGDHTKKFNEVMFCGNAKYYGKVIWSSINSQLEGFSPFLCNRWKRCDGTQRNPPSHAPFLCLFHY